MTRPPAPPPAPHNRPRIGWATLRAAFDAHQTDSHAGRIGRGCRTCRRYATATVRSLVDLAELDGA